ncbi:hypothetical protein RHSIM_RhsimUnG0218700 [Rhododendron simsii]|uniref:Transmembrane protein n=1 Tax=Rhododendron simsii TaxID=118357 RepID=A0A834FVT7_RHOSS|nr:hypothetical protein RHSIM_RhsimUnG0218700 [Rhododendron simsii]
MATPTEHHEIEPAAGDELSPTKLLECETMVQNLSGRISSLQKSAFTIANYYFVSQAVVFTALSTNTSLVCHNCWFPLFLSLLPGGFNLFAFFMIGQEYIETKILQKKWKELQRNGDVHRMRKILIRVFDDDNKKNVEKNDRKRLTRNFCCCMWTVGLLAAVVAVGSVWMLCEKSIIFKLKHNAK